MSGKNDALTDCPHCGQPTPEENLNCIYCGGLLRAPVGPLTGLLYGRRGWAGILLALLAVAVLLVWIL